MCHEPNLLSGNIDPPRDSRKKGWRMRSSIVLPPQWDSVVLIDVVQGGFDGELSNDNNYFNAFRDNSYFKVVLRFEIQFDTR